MGVLFYRVELKHTIFAEIFVRGLNFVHFAPLAERTKFSSLHNHACIQVLVTPSLPYKKL